MSRFSDKLFQHMSQERFKPQCIRFIGITKERLTMDKTFFGILLIFVFLGGVGVGAVVVRNYVPPTVEDHCVSTPLYQTAIHSSANGIEGNFAVVYPSTYEQFSAAVDNRTVYYGTIDVEFLLDQVLYSFPNEKTVVVWQC